MITVYPAIDLRAGRCVRLVQGDPERQQVFSDDPVAVARRWVGDGAQALHVVDLDGAFAGRVQQLPLVAAVAAAAGVPLQFGGGLRRMQDVAGAFAAGAARVVVGTRALEEAFLRRLLERWGPERIVAGLDARDRQVAVAGWTESAGVDVAAAAARLRAWGAAECVYTQVRRDGMLQGPDVAGVRRVAAAALGVVAAGGVTTEQDVRELAGVDGVTGVVLGRALYAGRITVAGALAAAGRPGPAGARPG